MFSKWTIFALFAVSTATGCTPGGSSAKDMDLLTGSPWKYEKAGFGSDDDGVFDALDPRIAGNEKDNMIIFCKDGTGYLQRPGIIKDKPPDSLPFLWTFQNHDSSIYFQDQYYKIKTFTHNRLEIYSDQKFGNMSNRYTIIFRR